MQLRVGTDDDIFTKYGSPSRPISPAALAAPPDVQKMTTPGNERWEIDIRTAATGSQSELEKHPQQQNRQQQSTSSPSAIPPELIDHIVDHLHDDKQSLIQCSRTSRVFSHATSYHLFGTISISSVRRCIQFQELVRSSLYPLPSTSTTPHSCPFSPLSSSSYSSSSTSASAPLPASRTAHQQFTLSNPHPGPTNTNAHGYHAHPSACGVPAAGWDVSRFVRKIEFYKLDPQSPIEEYVAEAVKLVRVLPRIREVFFGWMPAKGLERIGQAFAGHHCLPVNPPPSSVSAGSETRTGQTVTGGSLKLHLELVDFDSVPAFLDFLGSFGGRLRELSLTSVSLGRWDGNNGKGDVEGRCLPGLESVCLGFDAVVQPKWLGGSGPTIGTMMNVNVLFGILESAAPNVRELQLFKDDPAEACIGLHPDASMLQLPRFRRLQSVTMYVPGPCWSDLIYEIAAWFARDKKLTGEIADPTCHGSSSFVTPSLSSTTPATRPGRWEDWNGTMIRFSYPVRKGDVNWRKLENAVLGEDLEVVDSGGGDESDYADGGVIRTNPIGKSGADGRCSRRFAPGTLWVEVGSGSAVLGEVRGELGRLDQLGLLQVSCR